MAITDILVGTISIPTYITFGLLLIPVTRQMSEVLDSIDMLLGTCSMFHISLMAFDLMMAISKPLLYRLHMRTKKAALKLLTFPWLLATLITAVTFAALKGSIQYITASVSGIGVPFLFTITCYILALTAIKKRNKRFSQDGERSHIVNNVRLLKMVFCVLTVYLLCWLPFAIVNGMILQLVSSLKYSQAANIFRGSKISAIL